MSNRAVPCLILLSLAISACAQTGTEIKAPESKNLVKDEDVTPND